MKQIFECRSDEECAAYVRGRLAFYKENGGAISNEQLLCDYLRIMLHYIMLTRPESERNLDSIFKLMGASFKEKGYRTPFWAIIREAAAAYKNDPVFYMARTVETEITNDDLEELFDFFQRALALFTWSTLFSVDFTFPLSSYSFFS